VSKNSIGILLQGAITDWSEKIVKEYQENFPNAQILYSTWKTENVKNIPCEVLQLDEPKMVPSSFHINYQIKGALEGLKKMDADIIMKCRTDQVIHNKHIFELYEQSHSKNKIMIPNFTTFDDIDYWASDICQVSTRETLLNYWNSIEYFDGTRLIHPEIYLTMNYILHGKKDLSPWKEVLGKYFYVKDYVKDFQAENMLLTPEWNIYWFFTKFYKDFKKPDP
jgi:hypothetical protein